MVEECPRCGLRFHRLAGHWTGDIGLNTIVTFTLLFFVLLGITLATWPDVNLRLLGGAAAIAAIVVPLAFHPFSKTIWLAFDLAIRPLEPGEAPRAPMQAE